MAKSGKLSQKVLQLKSKKALAILGLTILALGSLVLIYNLIFLNRIFPQTYIAGINLGGKTKAEAQALLVTPLQSAENSQINFQFNAQTWSVKAQDLEIRYDPKQSAEIAWNVGRKGSFGKIFKEQGRSFLLGNRNPAFFTYSDNKLNDQIFKIAQQIDVPEKDAAIVIEDLEVKITPAQIGQKTDFLTNRQNILQAFGNLANHKTLALKVNQVNPKITEQKALAAQKAAQEILDADFVIKTDKQNFTLKPEDVSPWLEFVGVFSKKKILGESTDKKINLNLNPQDLVETWILQAQVNQDKVKAYVANLAAEINQEPKDAKFEVHSGRAVAFQLSQTGYKLDQEKAAKIISEALLNHQREVELFVEVIKPQITDNSAEDLGIKEVVGEATTNFSGSPENRRHNIAVGAKAFHGVMIKPGEEFSTLKSLGAVEASTGYLPELVIREDRTVPEYGGGLCQVSTTLFRTALNTGLKVTERQNHSYRVRYYEPPVGMDATIYSPQPDLKFINDLPSYILIQSYVDGDEITFRFYGTRDGRHSETTDPYIYNVVGSGEPIYTESPDLAPGEIKRIETAHPGSQASFTYRVYDKNNKLINAQKFDSSYTPWPARYLYGPGTQIPPPE